MIGSLELKHAVGRLYNGGQLCFHPNRLRLYSPVINSVLYLDLETNTTALLPFQARSRTQHLCLCQIGSRLLISDTEDRLYLFDLSSDRFIGEKRFKQKISHLAFSFSNRLFFVVSGRFVYIYETPIEGSGTLLEPFLLVRKINSKATEAISAFRLTSDDRYFIYAADDHVVRVGSVLPFRLNARTFELLGHKADVLDLKSELEDRDLLISFDRNGLLLIWRLVEADEHSSAFARGGKRIKTVQTATEGDSGSLEGEHLSALELKLERSKFILHAKHTVFQEGTSIQTCAFHQHLLLIGFANSTFSLYTIDALAENPFKVLVTFKLDEAPTRCLALHPTRPVLCSGTSRRGLAVWDYRGKSFLLSQSALADEVTAFAWHPTGAGIAVGDVRGCIKLFDAETYFNTLTFDDALSKITGLAFVNANTLVSASLDGKVRAYDLGKGRLFRELRPDAPNQLLALAVESGNGELLFASCMDPYEICAWSLRTGELIDVFAGHTAPVHLLAYAGTTQILLSGSWDRSVRATRVFDRKKNQEILEFGDRLVALRLAQDERWFAVGTLKNEIQLFLTAELQLFALVDLGAQFVGSSLSTIEPSFDSRLLLVGGRGGSVFAVDIAHRCVVERLVITNNREYRFAGEKLNSRFVRDGIVAPSDLIGEQREAMVLPGSKGPHQKDDTMPEFEVAQLGLSSDGKFLAVNCSEGLLIFGEKTGRIYWKLGGEVSRDSLLALLHRGAIVEFVVTCLRLEMTDLLEEIVFTLPPAEIHSVVRTLDRPMLKTLLDLLQNQLSSSCQDITCFIAWLKAVIVLRSVELASGELRQHARSLLSQLGLKLKDLVAASEFNEAALEYLLAQLDAPITAP